MNVNGKGLDLGVEPPRINHFWYPPNMSSCFKVVNSSLLGGVLRDSVSMYSGTIPTQIIGRHECPVRIKTEP